MEKTDQKLPRFNGTARESYSLFRLRLESALVSDGRASCMLNEPSRPPPAYRHDYRLAHSGCEQEEIVTAWREECRKASALLSRMLGDGPLLVVRDHFGDLKAQVESLDTRYQLSDFGSLVGRVRGVYSTKIGPQEPVTSLIDRLSSELSYLKAANSPVNTNHATAILLNAVSGVPSLGQAARAIELSF